MAHWGAGGEKNMYQSVKKIEHISLKNIGLLLGKDLKKIKYIRERYINSVLDVLIEKDDSLYDKFNGKSFSLVDKLFKEKDVQEIFENHLLNICLG